MAPAIDLLVGGSGIDLATYASGLGMRVDLFAGTAYAVTSTGGIGALQDRLSGIETSSGQIVTDVLLGSNGANNLRGGGGADTFNGRGGDDVLHGETGNDVLNGGAGIDLLVGGSGIDLATYATGSGMRVDLFAGTAHAVTSTGGIGALQDRLSGIENVLGSNVTDVLLGSNGANNLRGGGGADTFNGRGGDDVLLGETGNDVLNGGAGVDLLVGGSGIDLATYATGSGMRVDLFAGTAHAVTSTGGIGALQDRLSGIENVLGSNVTDVLLGSNGANNLRGGGGADTFNGRGGNDVLVGEAGANSLIGGAGSDLVVFNKISDSPTVGKFFVATSGDTMIDFTPGQDRIDLRAIDAIASTTANDAFHFTAGSWDGTAGALASVPVAETFNGRAGFANYVYIDVHGDLVGDLAFLVHSVTRALNASDFLM